ncbi:MAG: hypothetical protein ACPL7B_07750 [Candidatus Poribacteria bacterium]
MNGIYRYLLLLVIIVLMFVLNTLSFSQTSYKMTYPKARIFMKSGQIIQGERLIMDMETVTLRINGISQTFQTYDISNIMVKKGYAGDFALCGGGGCLALCAFTLAISYKDFTDDVIEEDELTVGQFIAGSLIWVAIFAGGGYLIGSLIDDWTPIFIAPRASEFNHSQLASSKINSGMRLPIISGSF